MKISDKTMLVFLAFGLLFLGSLTIILIPQAEATIIGQSNPPGLENKPSGVPPQHSQSGGFSEGFPQGFPPGLENNKPSGVPPQHSQSGGFPEGFPQGFPPGLENKPSGVPPQHSQSGGFP